MLNSLRKWLFFVFTAALIFGIDQLIKWRVTETLALGQSWEPVPALSGFIRITRSLNTGAAFGMFPAASNVILGLAIITIIAFIVTFPRLPSGAWLSRISIGMITGAALSNAIDRVRFDHVVDYFEVQLSPNFTNISNIADHAITLGVILLLFDQWRADQAEIARHRDEEAQAELENLAYGLGGAAPFDEDSWDDRMADPVEIEPQAQPVAEGLAE